MWGGIIGRVQIDRDALGSALSRWRCCAMTAAANVRPIPYRARGLIAFPNWESVGGLASISFEGRYSPSHLYPWGILPGPSYRSCEARAGGGIWLFRMNTGGQFEDNTMTITDPIAGEGWPARQDRPRSLA